MKLQEEPFLNIVSGRKTIESRLFDEKRRLIKVGDIIQFNNEQDLSKSVKVEVIALLNYQTFDALFADFPPDCFGLPNKAGLIAQIEKYYSKEDQKKYGVLGIKIKLLN
jgi:ASC-1-like (ASCH) protein